MPVQPPTRQQLEWIADSLHMPLTEEELDVFSAALVPAVEVLRRLDELPDEHLPVKYPRADVGHRPVGEENPSNGWAWKCSIPGAAEGPLAGRTVGIKDNVCVAGVPMLNGSPIMEGYVPREDATVVTRLLDAGAEIVGKTAVPAFCFDGGGLTGYPAPQPTTPRTRRTSAEPPPTAARRSWSPARPSWRWAATRAARSGFRPHGAGAAGTSRRTDWCPTPASSRSSSRSTTSDRWRARSPTAR